jgi:hypothetical protein
MTNAAAPGHTQSARPRHEVAATRGRGVLAVRFPRFLIQRCVRSYELATMIGAAHGLEIDDHIPGFHQDSIKELY